MFSKKSSFIQLICNVDLEISIVCLSCYLLLFWIWIFWIFLVGWYYANRHYYVIKQKYKGSAHIYFTLVCLDKLCWGIANTACQCQMWSRYGKPVGHHNKWLGLWSVFGSGRATAIWHCTNSTISSATPKHKSYNPNHKPKWWWPTGFPYHGELYHASIYNRKNRITTERNINSLVVTNLFAINFADFIHDNASWQIPNLLLHFLNNL